MATASYDELMKMPTVTRAVSRIKTPEDRLQRFFGCMPRESDGPSQNLNPVGGHFAATDIFDKTRTLAKGRAIGAGPAVSSPQVIGQFQSTIYRAHEKFPIADEKVFRSRPLGGQYGQVDVRGMKYITAQQKHLSQRFKHSREYMLSGIMRVKFDLLKNGEDWTPVAYNDGTYTVDFQVPAGNLDACVMLDANGDNLIAVTGADAVDYTGLFNTTTAAKLKWLDTDSMIINQMIALNAAMEAQHGRGLRHCWINSRTYGWVLRNAGLVSVAGSANVVFSDWRDSPYFNAEKIRDPGFEVVFKALPFLKFHVYDGVLDINGTITKLIPDDEAFFMPEPDNDWFEMLEGSELVSENRWTEPHEEYGLTAWTERTTQPPGSELIGLDNAIPVLYIPTCIVKGLVNFTYT